MEKERIKWIDIYKGIAIVLVVIGHCHIPESLYKFIYSFHLPAFFFISGYTFYVKENESFFDFVKKKAKRLVIPYFFFGTMWMLTSWIIQYAHHILDGSPRAIMYDLYCLLTASGSHDVSGPSWFLFALFSSSLIFYGIDKIHKDRPLLAWGG